MNKNLKAVYFCATNKNKWGKGYSIEQAKKGAGISAKVAKGTQYYVMAAIFDNPNEDQLDNLLTCITANEIDGNPEYYKDGRTDEDTQMIEDFHIGWITVEKNY